MDINYAFAIPPYLTTILYPLVSFRLCVYNIRKFMVMMIDIIDLPFRRSTPILLLFFCTVYFPFFFSQRVVAVLWFLSARPHCRRVNVGWVKLTFSIIILEFSLIDILINAGMRVCTFVSEWIQWAWCGPTTIILVGRILLLPFFFGFTVKKADAQEWQLIIIIFLFRKLEFTMS